MSRWLVRVLSSVLLLCYGACALAQSVSLPLSMDSIAVAHVASTAGTDPVEPQRGEPAPALSATPSSAVEVALDGPELFTDPRVPTPIPHTCATVQRAVFLSLIPPYLAGLERPPRFAATA
jgi:hypothetical protein